MSYTAPTDLFTSEEAILSLASSIADEDRTNLGNGTINGALDVLADALADQNVEVPPMNSGAILALAQYVTGGGGGSSDFTTAHVTINGVMIVGTDFSVCVAVEDDGMYIAQPHPNGVGNQLEFDAILYKGSAQLETSLSIEATSGAVEVAEDTCRITGDCTITVGNK